MRAPGSQRPYSGALTQKKQKPRSRNAGGATITGEDPAADYFARTYFETWALARAAAFLWTTPDLVALSIAEE